MFWKCFSWYLVPKWKTSWGRPEACAFSRHFQYRKGSCLLNNIFHFGPEDRVEQIKNISKKWEKMNLQESPLPPSQLVVRPSQSLIRSPFGVFRLRWFVWIVCLLVLGMSFVVCMFSICFLVSRLFVFHWSGVHLESLGSGGFDSCIIPVLVINAFMIWSLCNVLAINNATQ